MPMSSSRLAGLRFSSERPARASTHSPLMKFLCILGTATVAMLPPGGLLTGYPLHKPDDCGRNFRSKFECNRGAGTRQTASRVTAWAIYWEEAAGGAVVEAVGMGAPLPAVSEPKPSFTKVTASIFPVGLRP